jgi:hypothetical protein
MCALSSGSMRMSYFWRENFDSLNLNHSGLKSLKFYEV